VLTTHFHTARRADTSQESIAACVIGSEAPQGVDPRRHKHSVKCRTRARPDQRLLRFSRQSLDVGVVAYGRTASEHPRVGSVNSSRPFNFSRKVLLPPGKLQISTLKRKIP